MAQSTYESLILFNPNLEEAAYEKFLTRIENLIKEEEGEIIKKEVWGVKKLAYPVKKNENGYYVLLYFKANPGIHAKLDKYYKVTPDIWRNLTLKLNKQMLEKNLSSHLTAEEFKEGSKTEEA